MTWEFTTTINLLEELKQWRSKLNVKESSLRRKPKRQAKSEPSETDEDKKIP